MSDLRIGVIGFGLRRNVAVEGHRPGQGSRIAAVCDPSPRAREEATQRLGPEVLTVGHVEDLPVEDLDAVMVLTPDHTHLAVAT